MTQSLKNKTIENYFKELKLLNKVAKHNEMADLMLELQGHLIQKNYLTDDLCRTQNSNRDANAKQIVNIFLNVRREYQKDDEPCEDFSYIAVAFEWLSENGITEMFNDDYAEGKFIGVPNFLSTNKKDNVYYWDSIENHVQNAFIEVAKLGGVEITDLKEYVDVKEITEQMISRIKKQFPKAEFPYVDEDF